MARPKLAPDGESVRIQVVVPAAMAVAVDEWGLERGVKRSEAARLLLAAALDPKSAGGERVSNGRAKAHPRTQAASPRSSSATCPPHPVGRRIGDGCGACGDPAAWKKR